ncbi:MAG: OB-fold nucleic acid binding domain-containing protein [Nitrososphaerota archaeon]
MERVDKIESLTPSSRNVNIVAKVVSKSEPRSVGSQYDQSQHQLVESLIADETGAIQLVLWDENINKINEGDTVKITNAFVKVFRGKMQLNLGRYGKLEITGEELSNVNVENNLSEKTVYQGTTRPGGARRRGWSPRGPRTRFGSE